MPITAAFDPKLTLANELEKTQIDTRWDEVLEIYQQYLLYLIFIDILTSSLLNDSS